MMPSVQIKLYATLAKHVSQGGAEFSVEIESGRTAGALLDGLAEPGKVPKIILVDGVKRNTDHVLNGGEEIQVFPIVGGG